MRNRSLLEKVTITMARKIRRLSQEYQGEFIVFKIQRLKETERRQRQR